MIVNCDAETHQTRKGLFEWPASPGGQNATHPCPKNPNRSATRHWSDSSFISHCEVFDMWEKNKQNTFNQVQFNDKLQVVKTI